VLADTAKLKKKASLPKDKRLLNEKACAEILEFAKLVEAKEAEVGFLNGQATCLVPSTQPSAQPMAKRLV
jgi:hypothetical protein